ncbi:MAG: type IV secretory system conjugative DNA transfer family protein [Clostridia bacterium]|nr:type IV secretory system conjugative DNA transfer family protein [Clostridia bacterium]
MTINEKLLTGYENSKLLHYKDLSKMEGATVRYKDLPSTDCVGVLKSCQYVDGELLQTYSAMESHVGVIAATRLGKTTSYVIPTVFSFLSQKRKRSMILSDPKGEIYRCTAPALKKAGYKVKLINFRDYLHSECWNMLTPIFRKYRAIKNIPNEVELVKDENGVPRNRFRGRIYTSQRRLEEDIAFMQGIATEEVGNDIDTLSQMFIETQKLNDPYWEDSARDVMRAFLWAMLEDSDLTVNPITEDTYSFSTVLNILANFRDNGGSTYNDGGYFTSRKSTSRAYQLAKNSFIENAPQTRKCVMSTFNSKMSVFRESAMRLITSCNSFEMDELVGEEPVAIFIDYRDEVKVHYQIISLFVQSAYNYLISRAGRMDKGKLEVPFYFILDEFGNFPKMKDFETTISACAGRNIFFILIIQSYAQLNSVYGADVAEIIRDNLNMHVFFGSNNPSTLEAFSRECGEMTRISPLSALNGKSREIEAYDKETIPLVPKSALAHFEVGECIVTEANCGYVLFSRLERYYLWRELEGIEYANEFEYVCPINPFDKKYTYTYKPTRSDSSFF